MKIWEKEITIRPNWTRWDQKGYNELIYAWSKVSNEWKFDINMASLDNANDFLVKTLTGLTDQEISSMSNNDYVVLLEKCVKIKDNSGSK